MLPRKWFYLKIFVCLGATIWVGASGKLTLLDKAGYALQVGVAASSHQFVLSKTETSSQFKNKLTESGSWVLNPHLHFSHTIVKEEHYKKHTLLLFSDCLAFLHGVCFFFGEKAE